MVLKTGVTITIWSIILIIITIITLIMVIYLIRKIKSVPAIPRHTKVIIYGMEKFVGGRVTGFVKDIKPHPSGTYLVDYYPEDYTEEELNEMEEIPLQTVATKNLYVVPRGRHSKAFNIAMVLPKHYSETFGNIEELPAEFQKGFVNAQIIEQVRGAIWGGVLKGDEAVATLLKDISKGEVSREAFQKFKGMQEEGLKQKAGLGESKPEETKA
mgnify:FL=1